MGAMTQTIKKLLCDGEIDKKTILQGKLNVLLFTGLVVQEMPTMRRAKIKPVLSNQYTNMCESELESSIQGIFLVKKSCRIYVNQKICQSSRTTLPRIIEKVSII